MPDHDFLLSIILSGISVCFLQSYEIYHLLQVAANKLTLKNVTDYITDIICKRAELGYNYGVILIPEGLIDFIPEVCHTLLSLVFLSLRLVPKAPLDLSCVINSLTVIGLKNVDILPSSGSATYIRTK